MAATQKTARNFAQVVVAKLKRCFAQAPLIAALTFIHAYAYGQVQPGTPVSMSENGNSLPEPIHDKVRAAALLPDRNEAARAAVQELKLGGFFDELPYMNERNYYRCSREGQGWMYQAASNALNAAVMTQNRERYQKEFDGWWVAMEKNCDPQFWNAAKSRLLQLTVSLKGTNSARAAMADQVKADDLAKRKQEEEQKIAAATERNKRQQAAQEQAEATRSTERDKAAAASVKARELEVTRATGNEKVASVRKWKPIVVELSNGGTGTASHSGQVVKGATVDFVFAESLRGRKVTFKVTSPTNEALLAVELDGKEVVAARREINFVGSDRVSGYILHVGTFGSGTPFRLDVAVSGAGEKFISESDKEIQYLKVRTYDEALMHLVPLAAAIDKMRKIPACQPFLKGHYQRMNSAINKMAEFKENKNFPAEHSLWATYARMADSHVGNAQESLRSCSSINDR